MSLMDDIEYIPYRGRIVMMDGADLEYLRQVRVSGETMEQALERIMVEYEEQLRQEQLEKYNRNTMDYYLHYTQYGD